MNIIVQRGRERAHLYWQGGMEFEVHIGQRIGWVLEDEPSSIMMEIACQVRTAVFPQLPVITHTDLEGD